MKFNRNSFIQLCFLLRNTKAVILTLEEIGEMLHVYMLHNNFYEMEETIHDEDFIEFVTRLMDAESNKYNYIKKIFDEFYKKVYL